MNREPARPDGGNTARAPGPHAAAVLEARATPQTVDSHHLLQGHRSLTIAHQGQLYRLQLTRHGKLILTK